MRIAFFEIHDWEKEILQKKLFKHEVKFYEKPLSQQSAKEISHFDILSVFIYSKINNDLIKKLKSVKLIVTRSMGFDHIDLKACKKRGIKVCNAPHYGDAAVAEHTFALILSISRNIHKAYLSTTKNNFSIEGLQGFDLKGKTLGVIGTGRIGSHVIRIAKGFQMTVLAHDIFQNKKLAKELKFKYLSLGSLLKKSDIITLHVPYMLSTHHLINSRTIKKIKKGAILINTSRGAVVDTKALLSALETGILTAAGLDVLEGEELIKEEKQLLHNHSLNSQKLKQLALDHKLLERENVVFTPHIAFYSKEAVHNIIETTIKNIEAFLKNKPINILN